MAQCVCKLTVDVAERDAVQTVIARQGDSATRFLRVRLTACGDPMRVEEGAIAVINAKNAAGELQAFEGKVNPDGTLTLPVAAWMLQTVGTVQCDISVYDARGGRLTTAPFEIEVVAAVAADTVLPGDDATESLAAQLLAQEKLFALEPVLENGGYGLYPLCNRKYSVDLSADIYGDGAGWKAFSLHLPAPADLGSDNWILLYCHAPLRGQSPISFDWGNAAELQFAEGKLPTVDMGDFDVICT